MGKKKQEKGTSDDSNSTSSCSTVSDKRVLTLNSIMSEENTDPVHSPKIYQMGPPNSNPSLFPLPADHQVGGTKDAAFKSPGVEMAMASFTPAQWRELEKQAMIYKYIIASVPVPPDLLFSVISSRADDPYSYPYPYPYFPWINGVNGGGYFRKNKDLEPGRCKRTDGKKWRCSRDVAPHQKYCERHMNRGRPRSRKHVENAAAAAGVDGGGGVAATAGAAKKSRVQVDQPPKFMGTTHKPKEPLYDDPPNIFPPSDQFKQSNRVFGYEMEGGNTEQQWLDFMETKRGMDSINGYHPVLQQEQQQPLNLFSYGGIDDNTPTRGFIDAWSNCTGDMKSAIPAPSSSCCSNLNLGPPCDDPLTLSMALDAARMGHGPGSWQPFHSGGPLAEVLGPISPPGTSASSPRGILHRAVFSDGSVGNSPTLAPASAAPDLVAFQWLN